MLFMYIQWDSSRMRRAVVLIASSLRVIKRRSISHIIRRPSIAWRKSEVMCIREKEILVVLYSSFPFFCLGIVWENNTKQVLQPAIFISSQVGFILILKLYCSKCQCLLTASKACIHTHFNLEKGKWEKIFFLLYTTRQYVLVGG